MSATEPLPEPNPEPGDEPSRDGGLSSNPTAADGSLGPCPDDDALRRFATDVTLQGSDETFAPHVNRCLSCQLRLEQLARLTSTQSEDLSWVEWQPTIPGYTIAGWLGQGGMGYVYLAYQLAVERYVALKILPGGPLAQRSFREARAAAAAKHPHVVEVHDAGEAEGGFFLVMEYLAGGSLADRLRAGPFDPKVAAQVLIPVARAVAQLHRRGFIHLDLKPSNVLLDGHPETPPEQCLPKVADFGLARPLSEDASAHSGRWGTPSYMAPEQVSGSSGVKVGPLADVYALGAVLYHLLTGRPPFQAPTALATLEMVARSEPVPPSRLVPGISRDLETICLACLEKSPSARYASADELADDLGRFLEGAPIRKRPVGVIVRSYRWCSRNALVARLSAVIILFLIVGLIAFSSLYFRGERIRAGMLEDRAKTREILTTVLLNLSSVLARDGSERLPGSRESLMWMFYQVKSLQGERPGELDVPLVVAELAIRLAEQSGDSAEIELAFEHLDEALRISEKVYRATNGDRTSRMVWSRALDVLATLQHQRDGRWTEQSVASLDRALHKVQPLAVPEVDPGALLVCADRRIRLAGALREIGRTAEAAAQFSHAKQQLTHVLQQSPEQPRALELMAVILGLDSGDRTPTALDIHRKRSTPPSLGPIDLAIGLAQRATSANRTESQARHREVLDLLSPLIRSLKARHRQDPENAGMGYQLARALELSGKSHQMLAQDPEAESHFQDAIRTIQPFALRGSTRSAEADLFIGCHIAVADLHIRRKPDADAVAESRALLREAERFAGSTPRPAEWVGRMIEGLGELAYSSFHLRRHERAHRIIAFAREQITRLDGPDQNLIRSITASEIASQAARLSLMRASAERLAFLRQSADEAEAALRCSPGREDLVVLADTRLRQLSNAVSEAREFEEAEAVLLRREKLWGPTPTQDVAERLSQRYRLLAQEIQGALAFESHDPSGELLRGIWAACRERCLEHAHRLRERVNGVANADVESDS